jgi:endonuclease/exonuclease/phosphatase family metal-dependent hydrolase
MKMQSLNKTLLTVGLASIALVGANVRADAQTTVVLNVPAAQVADNAACAVTLDKSNQSVGVPEANWIINVVTASTCAWRAASDSDWLVVKSTVPATATGNGYAKVRAIANTKSPSKRAGHVTINNTIYTVSQGGCGTNCATTTPPPPPFPPAPPPPPGQPVMLRVLQYNTHHGGWGSDGVWDRNRILDWVMTASPDLISMNEIEIGTSWSNSLNDVDLYRAALERRTGYAWHAIFCEGDGRATGIGNMILSKYPLVATATQYLSAHRCAVNVTVAVNGRNINFTSMHLDNVSASNRITEVAELLPFESTLAEPRLILGDTNAWPGTTEMKNLLAGGGGYLDTWVAATTAGTAVGNGITHGSHRIDNIFVSKGGAAILSLKSVEIFHTAHPSTGVTPSDHEPVLALFEVK